MVLSCRNCSATRTFLQVEGGASQAIAVEGGDLRQARVPVYFADEADRNSVRIREYYDEPNIPVLSNSFLGGAPRPDLGQPAT